MIQEELLNDPVLASIIFVALAFGGAIFLNMLYEIIEGVIDLAKFIRELRRP